MMKKAVMAEGSQSAVYRQILLEQKTAALSGLGAKANQLANLDRICEEDQAQYSLSEAVSLKLNGLEYIRLRQVQEALDRMQMGEYGICLFCEEPIPAKRLHALPWAKYCVKCQEQVSEDSFDSAGSSDE